jgi:SAM-dependent methyltransferase
MSATESYDSGDYALIAAREPGHYWFEARRALIVWALTTHFPSARDFLELGTGTGFVLSGIHDAFPELRLTGTDLHPDGLAIAAQRVPSARLRQLDARQIGWDREFDVAGAFDVLEHVPEDEAALGNMRSAVRPGGGVIVTVPQHPWLWGPFDERAGHQRRYRRRELAGKVRAAGLELEWVTSFVSLPLPAMAARRIASRRRPCDLERELAIGPRANRALTALLRWERALIRRSFPLPVGGSLLLVARRPA